MSRIQGKQIELNTISKDHLDFEPGAIGSAEEGSYTDGIFTDFDENTPVGTAVDRFNEMFLLLAPAPPSDDWADVFSNLGFSDTTYSAKELSTGTQVDYVTDSTTPSYLLTVSLPPQGMDATTGTFEILDESTSLDSVTLTENDDTTTGIIQLSEGDPYNGESGKEGFWNGVISMSISGTLSAITPSEVQRQMVFTHPGEDSPLTRTYYINNVSDPTVDTVVATLPNMSRYVSGVPSLNNGDSITGIGFTISNAVSHFYHLNGVYSITGTHITNIGYTDPTSTPTTSGEDIFESDLTAIVNGTFSDTNFGFTVTGRNASGATGSSLYTSNAHRIDMVSDESARVTSGSGNYPSTGYNEVYISTETLNDGDLYENEMMLKNGTYQYPNGDYSSYAGTNGNGPDYSTNVTGFRWATFNLGSVTNASSLVLNINGSSGITSIGQSGIYIEIKIDGSSFWVDGNSAYGGGNPGSTVDGVGAVDIGSSTATSRRITFGTSTHTGNVIVRIGFTNTTPYFTSLSRS